MKRTTTLWVLFIFAFTRLIAQQTHHWNFPIAPQHVAALIQGKSLDTSMLQQSLSIQEIDVMAKGYYVSLLSQGKNLAAQLKFKADISIKAMFFDKRLCVQVVDQLGRPIDDAKVSVEGHELLFQPNFQLYSKPNLSPEKATISVTWGGQHLLLQF